MTKLVKKEKKKIIPCILSMCSSCKKKQKKTKKQIQSHERPPGQATRRGERFARKGQHNFINNKGLDFELGDPFLSHLF